MQEGKFQTNFIYDCSEAIMVWWNIRYYHLREVEYWQDGEV